jgi:hypothetical protein
MINFYSQMGIGYVGLELHIVQRVGMFESARVYAPTRGTVFYSQVSSKEAWVAISHSATRWRVKVSLCTLPFLARVC